MLSYFALSYSTCIRYHSTVPFASKIILYNGFNGYTEMANSVPEAYVHSNPKISAQTNQPQDHSQSRFQAETSLFQLWKPFMQKLLYF